MQDLAPPAAGSMSNASSSATPRDPAVNRAVLRQRKAAKKEAKRALREAHRLQSTATALATQAKHDPAMAEEAAEAQRAAAAAPPSARWTELVQCEERQEAARRCGQAVETLLRAAPSAVVSAATEQQGDRLLAAMGKGLQQLEMFGDEALLVYVRRKFSERALLLFTALREAARAPDVAAALRRLELCVSVGAGPCPCLFGYALAEELVLRPGRAGAAGPPRARLEAWDYAASAWEPWVRLVDDQLLGGGRLSLRACDVAEALERQAGADGAGGALPDLLRADRDEGAVGGLRGRAIRARRARRSLPVRGANRLAAQAARRGAATGTARDEPHVARRPHDRRATERGAAHQGAGRRRGGWRGE